ncbi:MAG: hypothetical protein KDA96_18045 [Planctomycetaceae bacterium]|nr:hypothetical protein [Planctomycetaceae bacterium]
MFSLTEERFFTQDSHDAEAIEFDTTLGNSLDHLRSHPVVWRWLDKRVKLLQRERWQSTDATSSSTHGGGICIKSLAVGFTVMSALLSKAFVDVGSLLSVNGYDRMLVARKFAFFAALGYLLGGVSVDVTKIAFRSGTVVDNPTQYMLPLSMVSCGFLSMVLWGAWPMFGPLGAYRLSAVGSGLFFGAIGPFWARQFGRMHLGKIRGLLFTITFATNAGLAHLAPVLTNSNWGSISLYVSLVIWVTAAAGIFFAQREPQANVR